MVGILVTFLILLPVQWQEHADLTMVTIDGKTDPVPEYQAWLAAFRFLDGGSNLGIPSVLAEVLTKEEQTLLLHEAHRIVEHQTVCWKELAKVREPGSTPPAGTPNAKMGNHGDPRTITVPAVRQVRTFRLSASTATNVY
jgi:hypothetical protein